MFASLIVGKASISMLAFCKDARDNTRMARPTDARKDVLFNIRLTEADRSELRKLAEAEGLSMSEYVRKHLLRESMTIDREIKK